MRYTIRYTLTAEVEVIHAYTWYAQPHINQAGAFLRARERTQAHLAANPALYQRVEDEIRRATLRRFPYSIFYVIEPNHVLVLACMHQHQQPRTREELLGRAAGDGGEKTP